jgi:hypothetical protein
MIINACKDNYTQVYPGILNVYKLIGCERTSEILNCKALNAYKQ